MPGPGLYTGDLNSFGKNAPSVLVRGKPKLDFSTLSPGPGAYSGRLDVIKEHNASVRLGSAERKTYYGGIGG